MKEDILFIGIGQAGSNIAYEMKKQGFQTFYINSTIDDVGLLDISDNLKYHIPGATGCGRNQKKALNYTKEHFVNIENILNLKFPMFKHIYICFSSGGGTGGGISPVLLSILSKKYPNKNYGFVTVLPSSKESVDVKTNSLECYRNLQNLDYVKNSFFLDNNSKPNYLEINKDFAEDFNQFIQITSLKSVRGNIDDEEVDKLIATKGNVIFVKYKEDILTMSNIYSPPEKVCEKAFVINGNELTLTEKVITDYFSMPIKVFSGFKEDLEIPYAGIFGLGLPQKRILRIQEEILSANEALTTRDELSETNKLEFIIPENLKGKEANSSGVMKIDFEKEFAEFL